MTGPTIPGLSTATSSLSTTSPLPLSYHPNPTATHDMSRCAQDGQNTANDMPYCPTNVLHPETQWGWKPAKQGHRRAEGEAGAWKGEQVRHIRYAYHFFSHFLLLNLHFHILPTEPCQTQTHANGHVFGTHHPFSSCYDTTGVFLTSPCIKMQDGGFAHPPLPLQLTFRCNNIRKKVEW